VVQLLLVQVGVLKHGIMVRGMILMM